MSTDNANNTSEARFAAVKALYSKEITPNKKTEALMRDTLLYYQEYQDDVGAKTLDKKFPIWAPIFASMLVEIALETTGKVEDCEEVLQASKMYRENQDYLAKFVSDKIKPWEYNSENPEKKDNKISKTNIQNEFREWWKREYNTKCPKTQELVNYLNVKLGAYKKRGWWGYEIIYDEYDSE